MIATLIFSLVLNIVLFSVLFLRIDYIHIRIADLEKLLRTQSSVLRKELKN